MPEDEHDQDPGYPGTGDRDLPPALLVSTHQGPC